MFVIVYIMYLNSNASNVAQLKGMIRYKFLLLFMYLNSNAPKLA